MKKYYIIIFIYLSMDWCLGECDSAFTYFNELPDNWTYLGLFIIVLSGIYVSRREYSLRKIIL